MSSPHNKLIKLNPHSVGDSTAQLGLAGTQKISIPITGLLDGSGIAIDASENIFIADSSKHVIYIYRKGATASKIFAGTYGVTGNADGLCGAASFNTPRAICVDKAGFLYVVDSGNNLLRKIRPDGHVYTVASLTAEVGGDTPGGICVDSYGDLYYLDNTNS